MPPVRIKVYGLLTLTKKTYLRIQGFGLVLLLSLVAAGGAMMKISGRWRPEFPPRSAEAGLILFFWLSLATILLEIVETTLVLRKFNQAQARQRAAEAHGAASGVVAPAGIQLPSGVQPTRPLENNP